MATPPTIPLTLPLPLLPRPSAAPEGKDTDLRRWAEDFSRSMGRNWAQLAQQIYNPGGGVGPPVAAHAPTHRPQSGSDPLDTATHTGGYGDTAAVGVGDAFLRRDARFVWPEALGTLADRTKKITLTDDATYGARLTASATWSQTLLSLFAPGASAPFVISAQGTIGRGSALDSTVMLFSNYSYAGASRLVGWELNSLLSTGSGGVTTMQIGANYSPGSASAVESILLDGSLSNGNANATGNLTGVKITLATGGGASRTQYRVFDARISNASGSTITNAEFFGVGASPILGTWTAITAFRQGSAFNAGALRRGVQVVNSIECTANDLIVSGVGKRVMMKDAIDGNFYALSFQNGILMVTNIGATAPTT